MAIKVRCPHCDEQYALSDHQAGKTIRCRVCQTSFTARTRSNRDRDEDEDERPRRGRRDPEDREERRPRRHRIPLWAWLAGGGMLVLLVGVLVIVLLKGGVLGGSGHRLTREDFEKVTKEMPDREVVRILGTPTHTEGMFGQRISWDKIEALKTMHWERGSTKIVVVCTGGAVNHMTGTFNDPSDLKSATWTEAKFDKLNWNQSRAEVRAILGPPVTISGGAVILSTPATTYTWKDGANEISVWFEGDRLYSAQGNFNGKLVLVRSRPSEIPDAKLPVGPSKLTEENFRKIKPNMTLDQIRAILGPAQIEGGGGGSFSLSWLDKHNNNVQILFLNKKLAVATAFINGKHFDALAAARGGLPPGVPPADH